MMAQLKTEQSLANRGFLMSVFRSILPAMAVVALAIWPHGLSAQECTEKLLTPDIRINLADSNSRTFLRDAMCRSTFEQFSQNFGAKTGGSYLDLYKENGDFNADRYNSLKTDQCRDLTTEQINSSFAFSATSIVPQEARETYLKCIRQQVLSCDIAPGQDVPLITINLNTLGRSDVIITSLETVNGTIADVKKGDKLDRGTKPLSVKDFHLPFRFTIGITQDGVNQFCTAYVGAPAPAPPIRDHIRVEQVGPITISQPSGAKEGKQWGPEKRCVKPTTGWLFDPKSAQISVAPEAGFCAQKPEKPISATEEEVCYAPMISINAGQTCTTLWSIQVRESRLQ